MFTVYYSLRQKKVRSLLTRVCQFVLYKDKIKWRNIEMMVRILPWIRRETQDFASLQSKMLSIISLSKK